MNEPPAPRHLSYRQPERPRMQVPPNYSGHAIVDGEERPLGRVDPPEAVENPAPSEGPVPRFDDLPRVSELGESRYRPPAVSIPLPPYDTDSQEDGPSRDGFPLAEVAEGEGTADLPFVPADEEATAEDSPLSAPAQTFDGGPSHSLFSLSRFPFGHGIGWEELLIMGLIWLLLHENVACGRERGDLDETVILLGLLLLLG